MIENAISRRSILGAAVAASLSSTPAHAGTPAAEELPTVPFGPARVSKLIVGGNPVSGTSHLTPELSREMVDYFNAENIKRMLRSCEAAGVNTWQSRGDRHILRLLHEYRLEGGRVQWIAQTATEIDFDRGLGEIAREKPIGIYHHGVKTDRAWAAGKMETVRGALKAIRQTGARVGLGSHIPAVIDYVESKDWDVDFYMTCLYNLSRTEEEKAKLAGKPHPEELFWDADRVEMLKQIKRTAKQCLLFKVYGATRHCDSAERMLAAFELAAEYAKPQDALVIGMFPKYKDQVAENCRLVKRAFGAGA